MCSSEPHRLHRADIALYAGLGYAFILLMIFPIYNAIESLDRNQIEAARDLGAPRGGAFTGGWSSRLPSRASPRAAPWCSCSPPARWPRRRSSAARAACGSPRSSTSGSTPVDNWPRGSAYAIIVLLLDLHCLLVLLVMKLFKVRLGEIGQVRSEVVAPPRRPGSYIFVFFAYLFGPLVHHEHDSFQQLARFPRVSPWECFSVEWFEVLRQRREADARVCAEQPPHWRRRGSAVAVPLGLAGALMLTQVSRTGSCALVYYTIVVSPILVPGVVLGISTLIFWGSDRDGCSMPATIQHFLRWHRFSPCIGQSTFISAYCHADSSSARLQRFDPALEEAALDLGATQVQAFRKILLPFLKPAVGSAAVLAFLASFENYNTTVFTILSDQRDSHHRAGEQGALRINPSISALAVIIVALTLFGAVIYEIMKRREAAAETRVGPHRPRRDRDPLPTGSPDCRSGARHLRPDRCRGAGHGLLRGDDGSRGVQGRGEGREEAPYGAARQGTADPADVQGCRPGRADRPGRRTGPAGNQGEGYRGLPEHLRAPEPGGPGWRRLRRAGADG